jgi:pyruvate, water dikinase
VHTRPLADLRASDEALFGGKSASLGELIAAEIPVPPGFGLASTALESTGLGAEIDGRLAELDADDLAAVRTASEEIGELVRAAPLPGDVRDELGRAYEALGSAPVAVRSSALGEDSAQATFAGQQETFLWVRGAERVAVAVRACWASLYSTEAISYRARLGGGRQAAMGVTVQEMVDASVSGVMFTCNPLSGDPSTVAVNASWGLGLAVVGGEVTPDEYRVSKVTGEVLHRTVGPKQIQYVAGPDGAVRSDVAPERQEVACLDEQRLADLVEVAQRVERHFGCHQDIEWALAADELFVLQSRPVTVAPRKAEPAAKSAIDLVMNTFSARTDRS